MRLPRHLFLTGSLVLILVACAPLQPDPADREATRDAITAAAGGEHRSSAHIQRNEARKPVETLDFFGLRADMKVVELWPGAGWYTEVLAPVLRDHGKLVAASFDPDSAVEYQARIGKRYLEKLAENPGIYGEVEVIPFNPPRKARLGQAGSADMVVTFRNLHGWINDEVAEAVFRAAGEVLRPGGVFGIVQHRAPSGAEADEWVRQGYVPEDYVIALARQVGFELADSSDINANPRDTRNHEYGVWTLPPGLRACRELQDHEREACIAEYRAIGESDRMTLLFVKL